MESYIEVKVPLRKDAQWFQELRAIIAERGVKVKWQNGHYHITLAFIYEMPKDANYLAPLYKSFAYKVAPCLTFDKLDVFTAKSGQHVIYLTSSSPSDEFSNMVNRVRDSIQQLGCDYNPGFKLHVTLGRVSAEQASLEELKNIVEKVNIPPFTLQLFQTRYLQCETYKEFCGWQLYPNEEDAMKDLERRKREAFRNAFSNIQLMDPDFWSN